MNRKVVSVVILFLVIVVGILAALWLRSVGVISSLPIPAALEKYLPVNPSQQVTPQATQSNQTNPSGVETDIVDKPNKMFAFRGQFTSKLYTAGDVIMGEFNVDGKTGAPVHILLTTTKGNFNYGTTTTTNTGSNTAFSLLTANDLMSRVKPNTHYELRITVNNPPLNDQDKNDIDSMRKLVTTTDIRTKEFNLVPQVIQELP